MTILESSILSNVLAVLALGGLLYWFYQVCHEMTQRPKDYDFMSAVWWVSSVTLLIGQLAMMVEVVYWAYQVWQW